MPIDILHQGQAYGDVASQLLRYNGDPGAFRPFYWPEDGNTYITLNTGRLDEKGQPIFESQLVNNAPATLRHEDWLQIDTAVTSFARVKTRVFDDLVSAGLSQNIPNGMGTIMIGYEAISDITPATVSMDGMRISEFDRPHFLLRQLPLPIIHKDFRYSAREIAVARKGGTPLDTTTATLAAGVVLEELDKMILGVSTAFQYGGESIYGYTNFPYRITGSVTNPTAGGWTPATLISELLAARDTGSAVFKHGPWRIYHSPNWSSYFDIDYSTVKGSNTVRERILQIPDFTGIERVEFLTGWQLILVDMSADTVQIVIGMPMTTMRWEQQGGMEVNFKVMMMAVPRFRADFYETTGLIHLTAA